MTKRGSSFIHGCVTAWQHVPAVWQHFAETISVGMSRCRLARVCVSSSWLEPTSYDSHSIHLTSTHSLIVDFHADLCSGFSKQSLLAHDFATWSASSLSLSFLSLSLSRRSALERRSNRIDSRRVASRRLVRRRASRERAREEGRDAPPSREAARDGRDGRDAR